MPSEPSRLRHIQISDSLLLSQTGQVGGANPEAEPKQSVPPRQVSCAEANLEDDLHNKLKFGPHYVLTLKNGERIEVAAGRAAWQTLNDLLSTRPALVAAALAKARNEEVSSSMEHELRRALLTLPSGDLRKSVRDVILSGYQETKDGPVIVNPFNLDRDTDQQAFEEAQCRRDRNDLRLGGFDRSDDAGPPPFPPR